MYRYNKVLSCFAGLIGFSNNYNADIVDEIDEDLTVSRSGKYVTDLHDLLTYENIALSSQQIKVTVRDWNNAKNYKINDVISSNNKLWRALRENTGVQPIDGDDWAETNLFSTYLRNKYNQSVLDLVGSIFTEKKLNEQAKQLLTSKSLYVGHGSISNAIAKTGAFRGIKLTIKNADTVMLLRYIGLQLTQDQAEVPIYLYHSSRQSPLKIFTVNQGAQLTYQWHKITEEALAFADLESSNPGGAYYIGYYEDDLTGQAIEKKVDFLSKYPCGSCGDAMANFTLINQWNKLIDAKPFRVDNADLDVEGATLWDAEAMKFDDISSPGINLQFAINCDLSEQLCNNNNVFTDALSQQLKVNFLKAFTFTLRNNGSSEKIAQLAASALGDNEQPGELVELAKARKAVSVDLNGLSRICSTCTPKIYKQSNVWRR